MFKSVSTDIKAPSVIAKSTYAVPLNINMKLSVLNSTHHI